MRQSSGNQSDFSPQICCACPLIFRHLSGSSCRKALKAALEGSTSMPTSFRHHRDENRNKKGHLRNRMSGSKRRRQQDIGIRGRHKANTVASDTSCDRLSQQTTTTTTTSSVIARSQQPANDAGTPAVPEHPTPVQEAAANGNQHLPMRKDSNVFWSHLHSLQLQGFPSISQRNAGRGMWGRCLCQVRVL